MDPEEMKNLQLDKVCRCCLTVKREMRPLFGEMIADMLKECTRIQLDKADGWPDKICMQCVQQVSRFHSFKKMVEKLDRQLRDYIKGLTVIVEEQQVQVQAEQSLARIELPTNLTSLIDALTKGHAVGRGLVATTAFGQPIHIQSNGQLVQHHHPGQIVQMLPNNQGQQIVHIQRTGEGSDVLQVQPSGSTVSQQQQQPTNVLNTSATEHVQYYENYEEEIPPRKISTVIEEIMEEHEVEEVEDEEEEEDQEEDVAEELEANEEMPQEEIECATQTYIVEELIDSDMDLDAPNIEQDEDTQGYQEGEHVAEYTQVTAEESGNQQFVRHLVPTKCSNHLEIPVSISDSDDDPEQKEFMAEFISLQTSCPEPGRHVCRLCQKEFKNGKWLHSHMKSHSNWIKANCKKQPECEVCHKKFRGTGMLKMHMKTHEERSLRCELCHKTFQNEYHLGLHMNKHNKWNASMFKCDPCGRCFISANEMKIHKRTHHKSSNSIVESPRGTAETPNETNSEKSPSWQCGLGVRTAATQEGKIDQRKGLRGIVSRQKVRR